MSVDVLSRDGIGETFFSNSGWAFLLNFAMAYGWHPAGTIGPPGKADWDGNYDAPEGQTISPSDARALADAVSKGLAAPDRAEKSHLITDALARATSAAVREFTFSPESMARWEDFLEIARNGQFIIW